MKNIAVFCGASAGADPLYAEAAAKLGHYLAANHLRLIYGGGSVGLMGVVADAVLAHGGQVTGVIPDFLVRKEVGHRGLSECIITQTMHERKMHMAERADAFVVLPGGLGTMDELFEIMTWAQLQLHAKPIGLLNAGGFFDPLVRLLEHFVQQGFVSEKSCRLLQLADDPATLLACLAALPGNPLPERIDERA